MNGKATRLPPPHWTALSKGAQIVRLWETSLGPQWPRVALLRLSARAYESYHADPLRYVNENKIFYPDKTKRVIHVCQHLPEGSKKVRASGNPDGGEWLVVLMKDITCITGGLSSAIGP